ncbi:MAG: hypothetical protein LBS42_08960 [Tannerella sp.]|jgi:hypothetical protein|nr:hypothetical protein [Tannerella sp.]
MGKLGDWLNVWEADIASRIRRIVLPDEGRSALVDADEVCFFGAVRTLPRSMEYLQSLGTPQINPEVYIIGVKRGELVAPDIWFAPPRREQLEAVAKILMREMTELMNLCAEEGFFPPAAVKTAVTVSTGQTFTKYEFDPLPGPPFAGMTAADWAFDQWTNRIRDVGSAMQELQESKKTE